jgi:hypothetical protein
MHVEDTNNGSGSKRFLRSVTSRPIGCHILALRSVTSRPIGCHTLAPFVIFTPIFVAFSAAFSALTDERYCWGTIWCIYHRPVNRSNRQVYHHDNKQWKGLRLLLVRSDTAIGRPSWMLISMSITGRNLIEWQKSSTILGFQLYLEDSGLYVMWAVLFFLFNVRWLVEKQVFSFQRSLIGRKNDFFLFNVRWLVEQTSSPERCLRQLWHLSAVIRRNCFRRDEGCPWRRGESTQHVT